MRVQVLSLWRNDEKRQLEERIAGLLEKRSLRDDVELCWLWIVGDSTDRTEELLRKYAAGFDGLEIEIINGDTGIAGEDIETRRRRLSNTTTQLFAAIDPMAELVLLHESDLISSRTVIDDLLANLEELGSQCDIIAGWPTIDVHGDGRPQFYDVWAYRDLRGRRFSSSIRRRHPFEVGSFGSAWLAPAHLVRGRVIEELCIVELCAAWQQEGVRLWCDPSIEIVQPADLWSPP